MDSPTVLKIKKDCETFGVNLLKSTAGEKNENTTISPYGVYLLSAIASYAATNETKKQLKEVLALGNDSEDLQGFQDYVENLKNVADVKLYIANKIVVSENLSVNPDFTDLLKKHFHSDCEAFDYRRPDETIEKIHDWFKKRTGSPSSKIISKDDLSNSSSVLLFNTVYFKGLWDQPFLHQFTKDRTFFINEHTQKEIPMMFTSQAHFYYGELQDVDAKFVKLPYKYSPFKLIILLPNKINGLTQLEDNLDQVTLERIDKTAKKASVNLLLPKFKIESTFDMKRHLEKMGVTKLFSDAAELRSLSSDPARVKKFVQKAVFIIDEGGPKAELAFNDYIRKFKPVKMIEMNCDRPFLAILAYKNLPLLCTRFTG